MLPGLECGSEEQESSRYYLLAFAKAFDSVVHSKLIAKLTCYEVKDMLLKWIEFFLVGRSQLVRIGSLISNSCAVLSCEPQGSVLGPVLFVMYVNDIARSRGVSIKLFADGTKLYTGSLYLSLKP
jgi:ribonuclease P/MRP protein subunit RPP40